MGCRFIASGRLKHLARGAAWWERFFQESLQSKTDVIFKIDADTNFHRPFSFVPEADFFGTVVATSPPHVQGGCQGFSAAAAKKALGSGVLRDAIYRRPEQYISDSEFSSWCYRNCYLSTDWTILHIMNRLGFRPQHFTEVFCNYRKEPSNPGCKWAITHPHKFLKRLRDRIAVVTLFSSEIRSYANITTLNKAAYCQRHGYRFIASPETLDDTRPGPSLGAK